MAIFANNVEHEAAGPPDRAREAHALVPLMGQLEKLRRVLAGQPNLIASNDERPAGLPGVVNHSAGRAGGDVQRR